MTHRHRLSLLAAALFGAVSLSASVLRASSASEPVRLRIELDRSVLRAGSTQKAIVKVAFDCLPPPRSGRRPPVNLALVIDRSGSMGGDKIVNAREAALEAVRRLAPDDIVSLIAYDTRAETLVHAQRVGDGRRLEDAIRRIEIAGSTALHEGVTRAAEEVRRHLEDERYVNRIILLSDGLANVGPSSPEALARLGSSLVREGISVTTIGLGLGFNEDLMTRLAQCSDGNTYFVENSADLSRIFAAELGDVLNVVARRVAVDISFPKGVRPLGFVGREGTISGQKAALSFNQLYGGQEKFALVEVEIAANSAGAEREIATATLSYEDAVTQRKANLGAKTAVRFSESEREVIASANHRVQADYAVNVTAMAKDAAVGLVDASRRDEAARQMRARNLELKNLADTYQNKAVQDLVTTNAQEADRLEQHGLSNSARKSYRAENMQTTNQQAVPSSR
ncbi:MAG: VWA domain-containing protein [Opitutaceae bacterium]